MSRSAGGFEIGRGRFFLLAFAFCLVFAVLGLGVRAAFPQSNPAGLIAKVEVWVDGAPNTENLERLISIRPGDRYSLSAVSDSIKQVYQSQLVSDVEVVRSGLVNVELRFLLTRKLVVRKIDFLGEKGTSGRKLRNSLYALREYAYFSEDKLSRATEELKRALNDEGYFQPKVEAAAERIPGSLRSMSFSRLQRERGMPSRIFDFRASPALAKRT